MTFIYERNSHSVDMYLMSENELVTSRLSKVIVWQTDRQTGLKVYTTLLHGWSVNKWNDGRPPSRAQPTQWVTWCARYC